jgi:hypothetical protein
MAYRPWQRLLDFLESHKSLGKSQILFGLAIIMYRICKGLERPLNSQMATILLVLGLITEVLTPYNLSQDKRVWESRLRADLAGALNRIRARQATNPLDKVFALHAVFEELGIALKPPDYTKSISEVYHDFITQLVTWQGSLEVLFATSSPGVQGVPSWVPDWRKHHDQIIGAVTGQIRAAGNSVPDFVLLDDMKRPAISAGMDASAPRYIQTKGKIIDRIASCTLRFQEQDKADLIEDSNVGKEASLLLLHNLRAMRQWLSNSQEALRQAKQSDSKFFDALFKLMHCEIDFTFFMSPNEAELRRNFRASIELFNSMPGEGADASSAQEWTKNLLANSTLLEYLLGRYTAIAGNRIFFMTEGGRLGTGPISMKTSNVVALFAGFKGVMILRERNTDYEVVGAAYVEGVMEGQAWPERKEHLQQLILA